MPGAALFHFIAHKMEKIVRTQYSRASLPAQDSITAARAFKALDDWRQHSQPGDIARGALLGKPMARAYYGAETPQFICDVFTSFVGDADFVLVNCSGEHYAAMRCSFFEMIGGGE